jgi:hypothetical protein
VQKVVQNVTFGSCRADKHGKPTKSEFRKENRGRFSDLYKWGCHCQEDSWVTVCCDTKGYAFLSGWSQAYKAFHGGIHYDIDDSPYLDKYRATFTPTSTTVGCSGQVKLLSG